ncbi:Uncharacterized protein FWK35_00025975, partial [Aphis craccivora]
IKAITEIRSAKKKKRRNPHVIDTQKAHKYNCERRDTARTGLCASRRWRQRRLLQVHLVPRARLTYPNGWTTFAPPPRPPRLRSPTVHDGTRTRYTPTEMRSRERVGFFSPLPLFFFFYFYFYPSARKDWTGPRNWECFFPPPLCQ